MTNARCFLWLLSWAVVTASASYLRRRKNQVRYILKHIQLKPEPPPPAPEKPAWILPEDPTLKKLTISNSALEMNGLRRVATQLPQKLLANKDPDTPYPLRDTHTNIRDERTDIHHERTDIHDERTDIRDKHAESRDKHADSRDKHADSRDEYADIRDKHADIRDKNADIRDKHADTDMKSRLLSPCLDLPHDFAVLDRCHPHPTHTTLSSIVDRDTKAYQTMQQWSQDQEELANAIIGCATKCKLYTATATNETDLVCFDSRTGQCGDQDPCPRHAPQCRQLPEPGEDFLAGLSTT